MLFNGKKESGATKRTRKRDTSLRRARAGWVKRWEKELFAKDQAGPGGRGEEKDATVWVTEEGKRKRRIERQQERKILREARGEHPPTQAPGRKGSWSAERRRYVVRRFVGRGVGIRRGWVGKGLGELGKRGAGGEGC